MEIKFFILIMMIFCHIIDDYYLQGWLASAKQRLWWVENAPNKMYRYDYVVALFMHSFSWAVMIMLIPTIYIFHCRWIWYPVLFIGNVILHMYVDDLKANKKKINLIEDQSIHMLQIVWTWIYMVGI